MNYVVGFMFSQDKRFVALIRKERPIWQKGKLNGIGGKIELAEGPLDAMVREVEEETGCKTTERDWHYFAQMTGRNDDGEKFSCACLVSVHDLDDLKTMEEEEVACYPVDRVFASRGVMIDNLPWLIPLALDWLDDGRPSFTQITYQQL